MNARIGVPLMNDSLSGDKTLVDKACSGDESAFATLINQHRSLVFGIIWAVLRDADDTEDATQETFILAYRNLSQLDDVGKFSSWLCTIARNVARLLSPVPFLFAFCSVYATF